MAETHELLHRTMDVAVYTAILRKISHDEPIILGLQLSR